VVDTIEADTIEQAKQIAAGRGGRGLVLSPEILDRIEAAEGFEGGMPGAFGRGGFSAPGTAPNAGSADDPVARDTIDCL
jgi:hypothetical protein